MFIEDGKGRGYNAEVDERNYLHTYTVLETVEENRNEHGQAYRIILENLVPTGNGACICYIQNSESEILSLSNIKVRSTIDELFELKLNDVGTPVGGTVTTPINLNAGAGTTLSATVQKGSGITGLSGGSVADLIFVKGGENTQSYEWESHIMLPTNKVATLYTAATGSPRLDITIACHKYFE